MTLALRIIEYYRSTSNAKEVRLINDSPKQLNHAKNLVISQYQLLLSNTVERERYDLYVAKCKHRGPTRSIGLYTGAEQATNNCVLQRSVNKCRSEHWPTDALNRMRWRVSHASRHLVRRFVLLLRCPAGRFVCRTSEGGAAYGWDLRLRHCSRVAVAPCGDRFVDSSTCPRLCYFH